MRPKVMRRPPAWALGTALALCAGAAAAQAPRSAIPWLSESLKESPKVETPTPPSPAARAPTGLDTISVTPLGGIALDAVGVLSPERTGFPHSLWGPTQATRVRELILDHPDAGVPAARTLFRRILLAEANPPSGGAAGHTVLLARVDRLLKGGALEEAQALLERAGVENPDLFRRMFDIGLLLGRAEPACEALRGNPALSPTLPARVFCLARDGDWNAAEITLTLGGNVGEISSGEELALARFLDPELFEHLPPPPPPEPFTPLDFLLREAVGLPRPDGVLPLAFLHHDLAEYLPMRTRITAAERLVLEGAAEPATLFAAYRAGEPAASGGLWDRAKAVQALDEAIEDGGPVSVALLEADAALTRRGLRPALATVYSKALAAIEPTDLEEEARRALFELLLLAGEYDAAAKAAGSRGPDEATLLALAGKTRRPLRLATLEPLPRAALDGLRASAPKGERSQRLEAMLDEGRQGEVLLEALTLIADGSNVDPASLRAALYALRAAGQEEVARRIAIETLLSEGGAT